MRSKRTLKVKVINIYSYPYNFEAWNLHFQKRCYKNYSTGTTYNARYRPFENSKGIGTKLLYLVTFRYLLHILLQLKSSTLDCFTKGWYSFPYRYFVLSVKWKVLQGRRAFTAIGSFVKVKFISLPLLTVNRFKKRLKKCRCILFLKYFVIYLRFTVLYLLSPRGLYTQ